MGRNIDVLAPFLYYFFERFQMVSLQETLNKVVAHARKQGCQAKSSEIFGLCKYRTKNGLMCFAGCLIPDELYKEEFEDGPLYQLHPEMTLTELGKVLSNLGYDIQFVRSLQNIHDNYRPSKWEAKFQELAADHNLEVPPIPAE